MAKREPVPGSGVPSSQRPEPLDAGGAIDYFGRGDHRVHGYLLEMLQEGERINRGDPNYAKADTIMRYISGEQDVYKNIPGYLNPVTINQIRKAAQFHVSGLTDIKPMFAFKTSNPHFDVQAATANKYAVSWWMQALIGRELGNVVRYALPCGSGDLVAEYDPHYLGGETRCFARDPRDTLAIFPDLDYDIQTWEGVTLREVHPIPRLLHLYPGRHDAIQEGGTWTAFSRRRDLFVDRGSAEERLPLDVIAAESGAKKKARRSIGYCTLYRTFIRDRSVNNTTRTIKLGNVSSNYAYDVEPGKPLYPYGRCIVWTEFGILDDGPNPYWHGLWPVVRIQLQPMPWTFSGLALCGDLKSAQDAINRIVNLMLLNISQHVERGTIWDPNSPASVMGRFDPRRPHFKIKRMNSQAQLMQFADVAQVPSWTFQFLQQMFTKFEDLSGMANFQQLLQLRQMPGYEVIDKLMESLTPEMRTEAEQITFGLRQLSDIFLSNLFQFQSRQKRMDVLGDAGELLEQFDWDPNTMVPGLHPGDPGYTEQLDAKLPRQERARYFKKLFGFYVSPQSLISLLSSGTQMKYLQLARLGYVDPWTLAEIFGLQNFGPPPNMPLPVMDWKPDPNNPNSPPPVEVRQPITILERLIAAQQLGIGQSVSPAGRKASGETPPHTETKGDGRQVISES